MVELITAQTAKQKKQICTAAKHSPRASTWERYKKCLKECSSAISSAKNKYYARDIPSLIHINSRKFSQTISPGNAFRQTCLFSDDNTPLTDAQFSSESNKRFSSVFIKDHLSLPYVPDLGYPYMAPVTFTADDIACIINNLKLSVSVGIDNLNDKN